jgi:hypothetical protein
VEEPAAAARLAVVDVDKNLEKSLMCQAKINCQKSDRTRFRYPAQAAMILTGWFAGFANAQGSGPKTFVSPSDASTALFAAIQRNDERAILEVLGPDGRTIVSSGDAIEDANDRANFVQRYLEMHRLVREPDGTVTLYIGAQNSPIPLPLVGAGTSWHFDTAAGQMEILYRRIGKNEIATIRTCQELVAAEKDYYVAQHNQYASKIFSDKGRHNGLYWEVAGSEPRSRIGPLLAFAEADGPRRGGTPMPYRGYYYRILTSQGKSAADGAKSYFVDGQMLAGFAFVAYPAEYRSSGVMTFIVGQDGVVYEKDLGKQSAVTARAMKDFDPDPTWTKSEDAQEQAAAARSQTDSP